MDVSKNSLSYYAELEGEDLKECWENTLRNRSEDIATELGELKTEALKWDYKGLRMTGIRLPVTAATTHSLSHG